MNTTFRIERAGEEYQLVGEGVLADGTNACFCIGTLEQCKFKAKELGIVPYLMNDRGEYDSGMFTMPKARDEVIRYRIEIQTSDPDKVPFTIKQQVSTVYEVQLPSVYSFTKPVLIPDGFIIFSKYDKERMPGIGRVLLSSSSGNSYNGYAWCLNSEVEMLNHNVESFLRRYFDKEIAIAEKVIKTANAGKNMIEQVFLHL